MSRIRTARLSTMTRSVRAVHWSMQQRCADCGRRSAVIVGSAD